MARKNRKRQSTGKSTHQLLDRLALLLFRWGSAAALLLLVILGVKTCWDYFQRDWDVIEPYRMVVYGSDKGSQHWDVLMLQYEPREGRIVGVIVPGDVMINVMPMQGEYRIESLPQLASLEGRGLEFIESNLTRSLGRNIRRVVFVEDMIIDSEREVVGNIARSILIRGLLGKENLYESLRLFWGMMQVQEARTDFYDLEGYPVFSEIIDVDGEVLRRFSDLMLDRVLDETMLLSIPVRTNFSVVVENTVGLSGLAHEWARILSHEGFDVIGEVSSDTNLTRSEVLVGDEDLMMTHDFEVLVSILSNTLIRREDVMSEYRSDVVVKLGRDAIE